jgi:hypothetical protein
MHFDGDIILAKLYSDRNDDYFIYEKSTNFLAFIYCTSHDYGRRRTYSMNINYEKFPNNLFLQQFLINIFKEEDRIAHGIAIYNSADFYTTKTRIRFNDLWNKFINEELNIDIK